MCAGLPESNQSLTNERERDDYESCREDPRQCCRNNKVQKDVLCGICATGYQPHPTRSVCERCDEAAWGGVSSITENDPDGDLLRLQGAEAERRRGGRWSGDLALFAMQLSLYAHKSKMAVISWAQSLVQSILLLEPPGDDDGSGTCTFYMSPYHFYFGVRADTALALRLALRCAAAARC